MGGGNVEMGPDGEPVTKVPIADYLHEMADRFGHCVWLVQRSGTWGVALEAGTARLAGRLDPARVSVVPIEGTLPGTLRNGWLFLRYAVQRPYAVLFLPACITLAPLLPVARHLLRGLAVYLAGDYQATVRNPERPRWFGWSTLFRGAFELCMRSADFVIARGAYLAKMARPFNPRVVETIPLAHIVGVEPNDTHPLATDEPRRILYVGLLLRSKGLDDLLRALRTIRDRRPEPPVCLDVLGDGPDRAAFEALARELELGETVRFRGWIEKADEMDGYFRRAHALVMPSSTHPEGVPRSIDEALVRLIPVVATRIAGVPDEFAGGEVRLVDTAAPAQLADAIEAVLFDREARMAAVAGAARRRTRFTAFRSAADQHAKLLLGEAPLA